MEATKITIGASISAPVEMVWKCWTTPDDILKWNNASADWHTTKAENDLRAGGFFSSRMEAKDGSMGFDFSGNYDQVIDFKLIEYTLGDGRKVSVEFVSADGKTEICQTFEAETENTVELQRNGWQSILNNFKAYTESV